MINPYDPGPRLPVDADGRVRFTVTVPHDVAHRLFPAEPVVVPFDGIDAARILALSMAIESPAAAASLVSLATVEAYLTARGWFRGECPRWAQGRSIEWHAPPRGDEHDDYRVLVPTTEVPRDYAFVIVQSAAEVAVHEERSGAHVLAAWLLAQHETGAYRVVQERT